MRRLIAIAAIPVAVVGMGRVPVTATDGRIFHYRFYLTTEPANPQSGDGWLPTQQRSLRDGNGSQWLPVGSCWYKVVSRTDDDWLGATSRVAQVNQLTPEPGMPQALGFADWQALYDDIVSENGVIAEVALRFESPTASNSQRLSFKAYPIRGRHYPIWNANTLNARDRIVHSQPVGTTSPWSV